MFQPRFIFQVNHLVDDLRKRLRNFNIYVPKGPNVRPLDMGKSDNQLILKVHTKNIPILYKLTSARQEDDDVITVKHIYHLQYLAPYYICVTNHVEQS